MSSAAVFTWTQVITIKNLSRMKISCKHYSLCSVPIRLCTSEPCLGAEHLDSGAPCVLVGCELWRRTRTAVQLAALPERAARLALDNRVSKKRSGFRTIVAFSLHICTNFIKIIEMYKKNTHTMTQFPLNPNYAHYIFYLSH